MSPSRDRLRRAAILVVAVILAAFIIFGWAQGRDNGERLRECKPDSPESLSCQVEAHRKEIEKLRADLTAAIEKLREHGVSFVPPSQSTPTPAPSPLSTRRPTGRGSRATESGAPAPGPTSRAPAPSPPPRPPSPGPSPSPSCVVVIPPNGPIHVCP